MLEGKGVVSLVRTDGFPVEVIRVMRLETPTGSFEKTTRVYPRAISGPLAKNFDVASRTIARRREEEPRLLPREKGRKEGEKRESMKKKKKKEKKKKRLT